MNDRTLSNAEIPSAPSDRIGVNDSPNLKFNCWITAPTGLLGIGCLVILIFKLKTWCERKDYRPERFGDDDKECMVIKSEGAMREMTNCAILVHYKKLYEIEFPEIPQLLDKELKNNPKFNFAWTTAESKFKVDEIKKNEKIKKNLSKFEQQPYSRLQYIALYCYTLDDPRFYRTFNKKCRNTSKDAWDDFPFKSMWYLLSHIPIDELSQISNTKTLVAHFINYFTKIPRIGRFFRQKEKPFMAFRGVRFHYGDELQTNYVITLKQFTSLSLKKKIALSYITKSPEKIGTLINFRSSPCASKSIEHYSLYPKEEEILVYPWSLFVVKQIDRNGSIHNLVLEPYNSFPGLPSVNKNKVFGLKGSGLFTMDDLHFSTNGRNSFMMKNVNMKGPFEFRTYKYD